MPMCEPTPAICAGCGESSGSDLGLERGQLIGLVEIVRIEETIAAAQPNTVDVAAESARTAHPLGMHVRRQMGRELRDDGAHRSQRVGQRQVMIRRQQISCRPFAVRTCIRCVANVLSTANTGPSTSRLCVCSAVIVKPAARSAAVTLAISERLGSELRFELRRCQPLMIAGRSWIGLIAQELFESVSVRQWQIDVEMRHGVRIRGPDCLDVYRVR